MAEFDTKRKEKISNFDGNRKNKKAFLNRYIVISNKIKYFENKLENVRRQYEQIAGVDYSKIRVSSHVSRETIITTIEFYESKIEELKVEKEETYKEIIDYIYQCDNAMQCEVLELYFIQDRTFEEIAEIKNYSVRQIANIYKKAMDGLKWNEV